MDTKKSTFRSFGSDNNSGVHPEIMDAVCRANLNHAIGYGEDPWTEEANQSFKQVFGNECAVFQVFNGTGANSIAVQACTRSHHAVIVGQHAHILTDECGAPFKMSGTSPILVPSVNGKLSPHDILPYLSGLGVVHHPQPKAIYISQASELGTVYRIEEIEALSRLAHEHDMYLIMDGARLANACAFLNCSLSRCTIEAGVDLLSFGGTKNGMMMGEAVICFRSELNENLAYIRKQSAQLASKMRYLSAQFPAYFNDDLYLRNARHANESAKRLEQECSRLGFAISYPVEANELFIQLPEAKIRSLQEHFFFYVWDETKHIIRLVCSWDTQDADIESFIHHLRE